MRTAVLLMFVLAFSWDQAYGFGYITSRFRPEAGYGAWGSLGGYRSAFPQRVSSPRERLLQELLAEEEQEMEQCSNRACSANEHCCSDYICMANSARTSGTCMAVSSQRSGDECSSDSDCEDGMNCDLGVCSETQGDKSYGEDCTSSSECDGTRGLCCQLIRRHRQAPKKMCSYYKDAMSCMGRVNVAPLQVRKRARPAH